MPDVRVSFEQARGCGYRKKGGLYLVSDGLSMPCGLLPIELSACPCCGQGIKPARGWTWVDADKLIEAAASKCSADARYCRICPISQQLGRTGLLWIGEQFYPSPDDWVAEAKRQGVSRRISAVPRDFDLGKTWVMVAHRKVFRGYDEAGAPILKPAVFHMFKPQRIEYVVTGQETDEELEALEKRGFSLVRVIPATEQQTKIPLGEVA